MAWNGSASSASLLRSSYVYCIPLTARLRRISWIIHSPITFLSSLIFPFAPPSLAQLKSYASSFMTGASVSVPTMDQVPLLIYNGGPSSDGTATTADPVSCAATAVSFSGATPASLLTFPEMRPMVSPGFMTGQKIRVGIPSISMSSWSHPSLL